MLRRALSTILAFSCVLLAAACDRDVTAPTIGDAEVRSIILRTSSGNVIYSHDDHWHGAPLVPLGGSETLELFFSDVAMSADDHDAPPVESWFTLAEHPTLSLEGIVEDPAVATWSGSATTGSLTGLTAGPSRISFVVKRGSTTLLEAPPLNFRVE